MFPDSCVDFRSSFVIDRILTTQKSFWLMRYNMSVKVSKFGWLLPISNTMRNLNGGFFVNVSSIPLNRLSAHIMISVLFSIALEHIPNSVRLWKETVNLESSAADARTLLSRAVEVIPLSVELWLALARLETLDKAKAVLNKAHKAIPTSHEIWIAAGRQLEQEAYAADMPDEQRNKQLDMIDERIAYGVGQLKKRQVLLTREQWLKEAERCETEGSPRTCEAIIKATIAMEVEEEDRLETWLSDAEAAEAKGNVGTARAILAYALRVFPDRRTLWRRAADLERTHGTKYDLIYSQLQYFS